MAGVIGNYYPTRPPSDFDVLVRSIHFSAFIGISMNH